MSAAERHDRDPDRPVVLEIPESALPGALGEVARLLGPQAAIAIARKFGGQRMKVPRPPGPGHPLTQLLGPRAAAVLGAHFAGDPVRWPSIKPWLHWYDARRLRMKGESTSAIARKIGLGMRQTETLVSGVPKGVAPAEPVVSFPGAPAAQPHACPCCQRPFPRRSPRPPHDSGQLSLF